MRRSIAVMCLVLTTAITTVPPSYGQDSGTLAKQEFTKAHHQMNKKMMIQYSGNVDIDFVRGMIPHHQGAVDMCLVELKYGQDQEIRQLCQNIIAAQQKEISFMNEWLDRKGLKK